MCGKEFEPKNNTQKYCSSKHLAHCEICGKEEEFASGVIYKDSNGRLVSRKACCRKCGAEKSRRTCLEKYGVENGAQAKEVKEKIRKTNLEKYGVENPFQSKEIQEKIKQTNLERFGAENAMQNKDIRKKAEKTNIKKYGGVAPACSKEIREKMQETCIERFGVDNAFKSEEKKDKIKQTNLDRYGVENVFNSKEIQDKIKATNLEKYGAENPFQSEEIKQKIKEINLDKYGVEHYSQTDEYKKKFQSTSMERYGTLHPMQSDTIKEIHKNNFIEKYGVENPQQVPEIKKKTENTNLEKYGHRSVLASEHGKEITRQTNLEKYGVEYSVQSPIVQKHRIENNLKKYGVEYTFQAEDIKEKIKQSNLDRYGVEYPMQSKEIQDKVKATNLKKYGVENFSQSHMYNISDWLNLEEFLIRNVDKYNCLDLVNHFNVDVLTLRKRVISENFQDYIKDFYSLSHPEMQFKQLLDSRIPNIKYIMHDRQAITPLELDFYFPEQNLAVEISPAYTHQYISEETEEFVMGVTDKEYHYNKFRLCEEADVELITIFDWEDINRVVDLIEDKLQPSSKVVYARKCTINYVGSVDNSHKDFLSKYHVLGLVNNKKDSFVLELIYQGEILGIAVYYPYKNGQLELKRLAFKDGCTITGGASKLVKNALKYKSDITSIITFSDNNLGTGSVYKTIGFELIEDNKYSCTYYNSQYEWAIKETSLWMQGADRLLKNFPGYTPVGIGDDLPKNNEIVMNYGFVPVYDCGYRKWIYNRK